MMSCMQDVLVTNQYTTGVLLHEQEPPVDPAGAATSQEEMERTILLSAQETEQQNNETTPNDLLHSKQCAAQPAPGKLPPAADGSKYREPQPDDVKRVRDLETQP